MKFKILIDTFIYVCANNLSSCRENMIAIVEKQSISVYETQH